MSRKTVTVEINKFEALSLLDGARENLGRVVMEYEGRETFQFLIDKARADVARWQDLLASFD